MIRWIKTLTLTFLFAGSTLYFLVVPDQNPHQEHYYTFAKQSLRQFLTQCSTYWDKFGDNKVCSTDLMIEREGYESSKGIIVEGQRNENNFSATASYPQGRKNSMLILME